ncbi:MAG: precorrin-3B C(17)-methyltransferase, partial [Firmicutes bacterium]|nr:precorrin-3B C(17)-methyltransferase [Bacillota bacterium]
MKKIYIVGLGPGEEEQMTPQALTALENSDIIVGYNVYINLIRDKFSHKNLL